MTKLEQILKELEQGKISADHAEAVILADMYPKEFVEWILSQEIFFGELSEEYILNDNPGKFKTLEDVFDYWLKNVKK